MTTITAARDPSSVRVVLRRAGEPDEEVELTLHHRAATAADLVDALRTREGGTDTGGAEADALMTSPVVIRIDGHPLPAGLPLRGGRLRRGSTVELAAPRGGERAAGGASGPKLLLRTVAGPDAGRELPLRTGAQVVGRGREADLRIEDPTLARYQAVLEVDADGNVDLTDLGPPRASRVATSAGGDAGALAIGDELVLGATSAVVVREEHEQDHGAGSGGEPSFAESIALSAPGPQWTVPVHRPPHPPMPLPPSPVRVPAAGVAPDVAVVAGSAAVVVTLAAGAAIAFVLRQPAFLLLSAVGAAGTLGAGLWYRGRRHAHRRAGRRQAAAELERFARELTVHQADQVARHGALSFELVDAVRAAHGHGHELWARRRDDPGAYTAVVGRGEQIVPPLLTGHLPAGGPLLAGPDGTRDAQPLAGEAWALVEAASHLPDMPVAVDLGPGAIVGIVGPAPAARALVRSLVLQLVTAHGPADLLVAGLDGRTRGDETCTGVATSEAAWLAWLPHTEDPAGGERLVATGAEVDAVLARLDRSAEPSGLPHLVLVIEDPSLLAARNTAARRLLSQDPSAAALVVADHVAALPSTCGTVVQVRADGTASVQRPGQGGWDEHVRPAGASLGTARRVALALAGLHDPERPGGGRCLPTTVSLADLHGPIEDADVLRDHWRSAGDDPPLRTRLALAIDGPVEIDLVRDGPHMLVAGTTGSGKSELLRALITGLAAGSGPEHLAFVLVDYKGGAAFDACARLPHVAGTATDLDDRLAERALRSLHAELRRREGMLRDAGAPDLTSYRSVPGRSPIPRLVVVVDEFATLAADLPGFIPSLVAVAQRGRSLGVHLVLATQRPAGAVSDDIRANTTIRVALRVQDPADSFDVVGDAAAAAIPRHRPGRAVIRFGPGDLVPVQVASVSLPTVRAPGRAVTIEDPGRGRTPMGPAALDGVVAAITAAAQFSVLPPRPWLPPLPAHVALDDLPPGAAGLLDDPDHQAQGPWAWDRRKGHALCIGAVGSGTTTALAALATAAAAAAPPAALHLYVVGADAALRSLESLPHTGSVISPSEDERQARLLRHLGRRLARRGRETAGPPILLVVDRLAGWRADVAARLGAETADLLDRILVEGPSAGIVVAGGLDRPGALPLAVSGAVAERLVFRLADAADAVAAGLRPTSVSGLPPGRACLAGDGRELQVALPEATTVAAVAKHWGLIDVAVRPPSIACLPSRVPEDDLRVPPAAGRPAAGPPAEERGGRRPLALPIGIEGETLCPATLELHPGDHLLVAGPARSGRTNALALLTRMAIRADPSVAVAALVPRGAGAHPLRPFAPCSTVAELVEAVAAVPAGRARLVVVDDAELVDDVDGVMVHLLSGDANVLAAGRTDALRSSYGHWTQTLRRRRRGLLLAPESELDGDLFGIALPRWPLAPKATGRGYLVVDGQGTLVQVAVAASAPWDAAD
jgi:S-DNA-T family DNA segregation ATPase FtsK/SpoIIIE